MDWDADGLAAKGLCRVSTAGTSLGEVAESEELDPFVGGLTASETAFSSSESLEPELSDAEDSACLLFGGGLAGDAGLFS